MKKLLTTTGFMAICLFFSTENAEGQLLKGFGKQLEKKIEERIERKTDRQVDKVLDKADKKTDEPIDNALNKPKNKTSNQKKETTSSKKQPSFDEVAERPGEALVLMGNDCSGLSWFKKGAVLEYEAFDGKGKLEGSNKMEVIEVSTKGSATIAKVNASVTTPSLGNLDYATNYICDGGMIYMDIADMMKAMMENNPELKNKNIKTIKDVKIDFDNGFASFPKKMHPGMKLDDLSFSFKTEAGGGEMAFQTVVTNRQVVARETIITSAGKFDCLKIRSVSNTAMNVMGFKQTLPPTVEYLWITPSIGMIKQETHSKGALTNSMRLKAYKM